MHTNPVICVVGFDKLDTKIDGNIIGTRRFVVPRAIRQQLTYKRANYTYGSMPLPMVFNVERFLHLVFVVVFFFCMQTALFHSLSPVRRSYTYFSVSQKPSPMTNAPSIWPMSISGLMLRPVSSTISARSICKLPVSASHSISAHAHPAQANQSRIYPNCWHRTARVNRTCILLP